MDLDPDEVIVFAGKANKPRDYDTITAFLWVHDDGEETLVAASHGTMGSVPFIATDKELIVTFRKLATLWIRDAPHKQIREVVYKRDHVEHTYEM